MSPPLTTPQVSSLPPTDFSFSTFLATPSIYLPVLLLYSVFPIYSAPVLFLFLLLFVFTSFCALSLFVSSCWGLSYNPSHVSARHRHLTGQTASTCHITITTTTPVHTRTLTMEEVIRQVLSVVPRMMGLLSSQRDAGITLLMTMITTAPRDAPRLQWLGGLAP